MAAAVPAEASVPAPKRLSRLDQGLEGTVGGRTSPSGLVTKCRNGIGLRSLQHIGRNIGLVLRRANGHRSRPVAAPAGTNRNGTSRMSRGS